MSSSDGTATELLPEGDFEIDTLRHPPYCEHHSNFSLIAGKTRTIDIRLGEGGGVKGRVVNDLFEPIEGAEITLWPRPRPFEKDRILELLAVTDESGCFQADNLPAREMQSLSVLSPDGGEGSSRFFKINEGEVTDIGDMVLSRPRTYSGRVIDSRGDPIAGALVSTNMDYIDYYYPLFSETSACKTTPWQKGSVLDERDSFTGGNGNFCIMKPGDMIYDNRENTKDKVFSRDALVWMPDGRIQLFDLPWVESGGSISGLEFIMDDDLLLELSFDQADGSAITPWRPVDSQLHFYGKWLRANFNLINVEWGYSGASRSSTSEVVFKDGVLRFQVERREGRTLHFNVMIPGYKAVYDQIVCGKERNIIKTYSLTKWPSITIRIEWQKEKGLKRLSPFMGDLLLSACLFPPEYKNDGQSQLEGAIRCCGLGCNKSVLLTHGLNEVTIPVTADGDYWIYASTNSQYVDVSPSVHGPFAAGGGSHTIVLELSRKKEESEKGSKPASLFSKEYLANLGTVKLRVKDGATNEPVENLRPSFHQETPGSKPQYYFLAKEEI